MERIGKLPDRPSPTKPRRYLSAVRWHQRSYRIRRPEQGAFAAPPWKHAQQQQGQTHGRKAGRHQPTAAGEPEPKTNHSPVQSKTRGASRRFADGPVACGQGQRGTRENRRAMKSTGWQISASVQCEGGAAKENGLMRAGHDKAKLQVRPVYGRRRRPARGGKHCLRVSRGAQQAWVGAGSVRSGRDGSPRHCPGAQLCL